MINNLDEVKAEAVSRMKSLNLMPQCIRAFKRKTNSQVWMSEGPFGGLYTISDKRVLDKIKELANDGYIVYHAIHNQFEFGECYSFLYVSAEATEEWEYDRNDLSAGEPMAYVFNVDDDYCSEFGTIGIRPKFGGVVRIA